MNPPIFAAASGIWKLRKAYNYQAESAWPAQQGQQNAFFSSSYPYGPIVQTVVYVSYGGVVSDITPIPGAGKDISVGTSYGGDRALLGFGSPCFTGTCTGYTSDVQHVTNEGIFGIDTTTVASGRQQPGSCTYGGDKAMIAFGYTGAYSNITNTITNQGVVNSDNSGVGTGRYVCNGLGYGGDKGIFAYGFHASGGPYVWLNVSNLVSNTGTLASDTAGVGTARGYTGTAGYGGDKGIFLSGGVGPGGPYTVQQLYNLVSNTGVVQTDTSWTSGIARMFQCNGGATYDSDKAIFIGGFTYSTQTGSIGGTPGMYVYTNNVTKFSNTGTFSSEYTLAGQLNVASGAANFGGSR